jgi:hypothetical protein
MTEHSSDLNSASLVPIWERERESQWQTIPIPIYNKIPNFNHKEANILTCSDVPWDPDGVLSWNWSEPKTAHIDWSNASSPIFRKCWLELSASCKIFLWCQEGCKWCYNHMLLKKYWTSSPQESGQLLHPTMAPLL